MYEIADEDNEPIIGKFYEDEMSHVGDGHEYKIEKILRKRKGMVLIKWLGYDSKHNSCIPENEVNEVERSDSEVKDIVDK